MLKDSNRERFRTSSVDDLFKFSTDKGKMESIIMIPINQITSFTNHPFKVRDDEKDDGNC